MTNAARTGDVKWTRVEARVLAVALFVAASMRILHWESMHAQPWTDFLGLDSKYYDEWAQRILREGLQGENPFFMGPLYPYFLAFVYKLAGRSLDVVRALQIVMSVASVGLLHVLARRFGGPALAMIASCACAVYGPIVYATTSILFDATIPILLSCVLLLALLESASRRSVLAAFCAGLSLGVWALGRANILLFAPAAFFWLAAAWGRPFAPRLGAWRDGASGALALAAGTLLAILPATVHNIRTGDAALITTNGGLNLYIGNGPMASGGHETPVLEVKRPDGTTERIVADLQKDVECKTEAERVVGRPMKYTEVSDFYAGETWRALREAPGPFFSRFVRKIVLFWSDYEIPQIEHFGYFRKFSFPLSGPVLTFGAVAPLAIVGMGLAMRRRERGKWALPLLFVATFSTSVILFFVLDRYRLPIVPVLLVFAAYAALAVRDAVRERRFAFAGGLVGAALVLGLALRSNPYRIDEKRGIAQIVYRLGIVEDSRENWEAAAAHYREAIALKPEYDRAHLNLATDLARLGRGDEAMEHFRLAETLNPTYYRIPYNRGALLDESGRATEAEDAYRRSVELEPRYLLGHVALAELLLARGAADSARAHIGTVISYDGQWQAELNPAARVRAMRLTAALDEIDRLSQGGVGDCFRESEMYRRAEVARLRGRDDEALARLQQYFESGGTCAEAYRALGQILIERNEVEGAEDAFQRAVRAAPRISGARRELGRIAAMRGDADGALRELEEEARVNPTDPSTYLEIGLVHERLRDDSALASKWFTRYLERGGDEGYLESRRRSWKKPTSRGAP